MMHLCKDPKGETVLEPSSATDMNTKSAPMTDVTDHLNEIAGLKQQVIELEKKLAEVLSSSWH